MIREVHAGLRRFRQWRRGARKSVRTFFWRIAMYPLLKTYDGARVYQSPLWWHCIEREGVLNLSKTRGYFNWGSRHKRDRWGLGLAGIWRGIFRPKTDPSDMTWGYRLKGPGPGFTNMPPPLISRMGVPVAKAKGGSYRFYQEEIAEVPDSHCPASSPLI